MKLKENTLIGAVNKLKAKGYTEELRIHRTHLHALNTDKKLEAKDFFVDGAYRFEGVESQEDSSALYAISSPVNAIKGILIDALDMYRKLPDHPIIEKLVVDHTTYTYEDSKVDRRYGLPKVFKAKFNGSPERYELRKGFPDFPECPFGNSFQMLGYDLQEKEYVWLVTSILKDDRLNTVEYNK